MNYKNKQKKIYILFLSFIVVVFMVGIFLYGYIYVNYNKLTYINKTNYISSINKEDNINKESNIIKEKQIKNEIEKEIEKEASVKDDAENSINNQNQSEKISNILLIGIDARTKDAVSRSDTMMILSINEKNKKIKITSLMRDTYADIPGYEPQKLNHSFAFGGPELLLQSIKSTFDVNIDKYVIIDFNGFKEVIDVMGGIDVNITDEQVKDLNDCMYGINEENITEVMSSGYQHLNGMQALAYARMRHTGDGTFDRVKRQRELVELVINKLKQTSVIKYPSLATSFMKSIKTNASFTEGLDLAYTVYSFNTNEIEQLQIPAPKISKSIKYKDKGWVILMDKESNKKVIHDFIYKDIPYNQHNYKKFSYEESEYYIEEENNSSNSLNSNYKLKNLFIKY